MMLFLTALSVLSVVSAQIQAPIPLMARDPGFRLDESSKGTDVKLEAFIELLCPDSNYSWPILKELQEFYGPDKLEVVIHLTALPYHRQAILTVQGFYYVLDERPDRGLDYLNALFDNFASLSNSRTEELSENQVVDLLGNIQEEATGIPSQVFADNVYGYESSAIRTWKYATRRGIAGTPWFVLNNVDLAVNPSIRLSYEDWRETLDPLFPDLKTDPSTGDTVHQPEKQVKLGELLKSTKLTKDKKETNQMVKNRLKDQAKRMVSLKLVQALNTLKKQHNDN